jgi:hypothetical protein
MLHPILNCDYFIAMREYARLDFHGGYWHLVTNNTDNPDRKWTSWDSALSDLISEGWVIDGPHIGQPTMKHDANRHFYGYGLMRTVH